MSMGEFDFSTSRRRYARNGWDASRQVGMTKRCVNETRAQGVLLKRIHSKVSFISTFMRLDSALDRRPRAPLSRFRQAASNGFG
jgi:hypothetical protein